MAIITCENCGKKYSDKTPGGCPNCQPAPRTAKPKPTPMQATILIVLAIMLFTAIIRDAPLSSLFDHTPIATINAHQLYTEYNNNELAADAKYGGKYVTITGTYRGNGISMGAPYIMIGRGTFAPDVFCDIKSSEAATAGRLKIGQQIKIKGKVNKIFAGAVHVKNGEIL